MDNPQEIKKALLSALVEKGDLKTVLKAISDDESRTKDREKEEQYTNLLKPISALAALFSGEVKGDFMQDLTAQMDKAQKQSFADLSKDIQDAKNTLQNELQSLLSTTKSELLAEHLARYKEAETALSTKLIQMAVDVVSAKANELLPSLANAAKLTSDEINDIIETTALSVESQMAGIVGDYVAEQTFSVDQITGFSEAVKKLLPEARQITWNEIVGKPEMSQGGTNTNIVRQLIAEAIANIPGGDGSGDMLAATYDPANGAKQVAFADEVATAAQGALAASASQPGHTHTASNITDFDTEVSNNTDVAANTTARHAAVTVSGSPNYITLVGQDIVRALINLTSHVTGLLPFANFADGSALSVTGRSANSTGVQASIAAGSDHQVLRRSGTTLAFGAVNLAQTAAVTGSLPVANGGSGRATGTTAYGLVAVGTTATGAQQTISPGTSGHILKSNGASALPSFSAGAKGDVGLGNVDNTSDANKPVSTATQTALDLKLNATAYDDATAAETNTGTSTTKYVSPDGLAGSYAGTKSVSIQVFDGATDVATGDGKAFITIPESLNGMNLVRAQATVVTAGTTNATTVMIHNKTDAADMLSGAISIASGGTVGTVGTINTSTDDVATNDVLRIDVDSVSTTEPLGLMVLLEFRLP